MARIACLVVPNLPLQALLRAEPSLYGVPLAVTDPVRSSSTGTGARTGAGATSPARPTRGAARSEPALTSRVLAASVEALREGVRPGQTAAQARATCPALVVRVTQPEQTAAARGALFDVALGFAPRVEPSGDAVYIEVGDLGRLYPRESELAAAIRARALRVGLRVGVGIASSKGVSRIAAAVAAEAARDDVGDSGPGSDATADSGSDLRIVPSGGEAAFVAPLSVHALFPAAALDGTEPGGVSGPPKQAIEALAALARWGVETAGRLASLPEREVAVRLGAAGTRLHRLATGRCDEPLAPRAPTDELAEGLELDFTVDDLEALAFVLRGLLDRLLARLHERRLACAGLVLRLKLEGGGYDVREVPIGAPTLDAPSLLTLLRLDVERRSPDAGIVGVTLYGRAACARPDQLDMFRPAGPAPEALATTVAKLQALLGDGAVGSPRPVDTHREEAIAVGPFTPAALQAGRMGRATGAGRRASSPAQLAPQLPPQIPPQVPPPLPAEVRVNEVHVARPAAAASPPLDAGPLGFRRFRPELEVEVILDGRSGPRALSAKGLQCGVLVAAGPFRAEGEWWSASAFARDYWDVHATDGALYRLYRNVESRWYLAGYYD